MDQWRGRLVRFSLAVVVFHVVTTVLCVVMRWPAQFGGAGDPGNVVLSLVTLYLVYRLVRNENPWLSSASR